MEAGEIAARRDQQQADRYIAGLAAYQAEREREQRAAHTPPEELDPEAPVNMMHTTGPTPDPPPPLPWHLQATVDVLTFGQDGLLRWQQTPPAQAVRSLETRYIELAEGAWFILEHQDPQSPLPPGEVILVHTVVAVDQLLRGNYAERSTGPGVVTQILAGLTGTTCRWTCAM